MCQSWVPERIQPAPRKPGNRSAMAVPACTHACMRSPSSGATRRVIATVRAPSPTLGDASGLLVLMLMLMGLLGRGGRFWRVGRRSQGGGRDDAGRPEVGRPASVVPVARQRRAWDVRNTSLTHAEAGEGRRRGADLLEDLADRLLGVLGERLLEQDVLLEEAVDATLDDLGQGGLGLALLAGRGLGDATLVLDRLGRDLVTREDRRAERRDVHRDVATDLVVATLDRHEDTDLRRQVGARLVEVGGDVRTLDAGDALDLDLLADRRVRVVEQLLDRAAVGRRAREELLGARGLRGDGLLEDLVGQGDELLALRDEVGLAEDLDQGADAVGRLGRDETVGGRSTLTLRHALEALDAQHLDGLGAVAVSLVERLLDVHHSGAGLLAQGLDVSGGVVRHALYRSFRQWRLTRVSAGSDWC